MLGVEAALGGLRRGLHGLPGLDEVARPLEEAFRNLSELLGGPPGGRAGSLGPRRQAAPAGGQAFAAG
eukprot:4307165-Lingulodinium_polyedra.AAC.1